MYKGAPARALEARIAPQWVAGAVGARLGRLGVEFVVPIVCAGWEAVALPRCKISVSAWATSRRIYDAHVLPCVFGRGACAGGVGDLRP